MPVTNSVKSPAPLRRMGFQSTSSSTIASTATATIAARVASTMLSPHVTFDHEAAYAP